MFLLQKIHLNMTETLKAEYWNFSSIWGFGFCYKDRRLILEVGGVREPSRTGLPEVKRLVCLKTEPPHGSD